MTRHAHTSLQFQQFTIDQGAQITTIDDFRMPVDVRKPLCDPWTYIFKSSLT